MRIRLFAYFALATMILGTLSAVAASGVPASRAVPAVSADQAWATPELTTASDGAASHVSTVHGHIAQGLCLVACFVLGWAAPDVGLAAAPDDAAPGHGGPAGPMDPVHQVHVGPRPGPPKAPLLV